MQKDIRKTPLYREAEALFQRWRQPGTGQISDATGVHVCPDGTRAVFAGSLADTLDGGAFPTRICSVDLSSGQTSVLTFGPHTDRSPKYAPDGHQIAFISDRHQVGDFQLYLLDLSTGAARSTPTVEGWVEYAHWSPNGQRLLLGVANHGADVSGGQGAITSHRTGESAPSWLPVVQSDDESHRWRRAWVYELATGQVRPIGRADCNIWEAVWCGNNAIAVVASPGPGEGLWYSAHLHVVPIDSGISVEIYRPRDQLGWPSASPGGEHLAVVEAVCSDRGLVAGNLRLIDTRSGTVEQIDTHGVDVTHTEWQSDRSVLVAGHRSFETVTGTYDVSSRTFAETWASRDLTSGGIYVAASGFGDRGDCVLVGESFTRAPEITVLTNGEYRSVRTFDLGYSDDSTAIAAVDQVSWNAQDGLEIRGWLLRPKGPAPHPLIINIHGGPVWQWRPMWLGRAGASSLMLLKRGYAIFLPNPRGSSGRGQEFARRVFGDVGGADADDLLSGLDYLVEKGIADPKRLGIIGSSYGGFMTTWLIGQDSRFAAAVAVAPVTNHVTAHLMSNIPHYVQLSLADTYTNLSGRYFQRSPIMHAQKVKTPTLNICGALDRCTPPEEAVQFHNALLSNGVKSVLVTYPEEGHGIRKFPAAIDYAARVVSWFDEHMPPDDQTRRR